MYEVKWMPKTAAELEELCNKAVEHGFELVACNDKFCVFKSAQQSVHPTVTQAVGQKEKTKMVDPLFDEAKEWSRKQGYVSVSYIQRIMRVGYTRAARLVDLMIEQGFCEAEFAEGKGYRALKSAQQNAHPTLGESATSQAVTNAENLATSDGVPPSAPARVA